MSDLVAMGDQLLLYLQEHSIPINCSVYSLPSGSLSMNLFNDTTTTTTQIDPNFLPAYYVTNCLISSLIELVVLLHRNDTNIYQSPYNQRDNGDMFVALLFTLCASCVSCWMLILLLYLCPAHKRKPILAQLATIFYAVVTTFLLSRITEGSQTEYYMDTLDIVRLHDMLYINNVFRVIIVISQVLTHVAWLQIVVRLTKDRFKWMTSVFGGTFILAYFIICTYYEIAFNDTSSIFSSTVSSDYQEWRIVRIVLKLGLLFWFAGTILYYTICIKNPRRICYSRKLLPLALFNWFLIGACIAFNILSLSAFKEDWLVKTWLELLPYLVEIILITTVWEWVYNIWYLEKRSELVGVLGRKISMDDVLSIHLSQENKEKSKRKGFLDFFNKSSLSVTKYDSGSTRTKDETYEDSNSSNLQIHTSRTLSIHDPDTLLPVHENQYGDHPPALIIYEDDELEPEMMVNHDGQDTNMDHPPSPSAGSYDEEIVDNYEIWDDDDHLLHQSQQPPPFEPHPGFNSGDYWPSRKN
ncbi:PalH-domain-containing protein [Suhomyces tanzawaensis NRRL Y-17324]|uniref:PalH-domain-containing protein n=1 Tax=Suhomyces tanzawaensis NRRL Y-17324 TaxID=984487 RepID=A0A1E4SQH5_9ASCO|nr:PalH-domain-containing protein [Suhomyces tanzawaensis NRRL Y-17324]ODV81763.1 PalH-domain-containing protein [Suhomyces tanzawaensis NRRL Y-17324]